MDTVTGTPAPNNAPKKSKKLFWIIGIGTFCCLGCCVVPTAFMGLLGVGAHQHALDTAKKIEEEPPMDVTVSQIVSDFRSNAASANVKYKDKILQITGTVEKIEENYVVLQSNNGFVDGGFDLLGVNVYFSDSEKSKMMTLNKGQTIVIKGICTGKGFADSINIENCVMVKQ